MSGDHNQYQKPDKPEKNWPTPSEQYAFERGFQRAREITFELWQWLTDEEIGEIIEASQITLKNYCSEEKQIEFARAIEAKLRRKNEQPCLF